MARSRATGVELDVVVHYHGSGPTMSMQRLSTAMGLHWHGCILLSAYTSQPDYSCCPSA